MKDIVEGRKGKKIVAVLREMYIPNEINQAFSFHIGKELNHPLGSITITIHQGYERKIRRVGKGRRIARVGSW